jgi:hypothetical protein
VEKQFPHIMSSFTNTTHRRQSRPVKTTYIGSPAKKGEESIACGKCYNQCRDTEPVILYVQENVY